MQTVSVDPSVSRTPLPLDADDVATACVLCSHNCGLRVDVRGGEITAVRADEHNPDHRGLRLQQGVQHPGLRRARAAHAAPAAARGPTARSSASPGTRRSREIAAKLRDIRDRHSPRAIALVGIGGQGNHMDGAYGVGFLRSARLAALVQRLRAGEDAAQPAGPVDVRRVAGGVLPSRRRAHAVPPGHGDEPEDLQPRAQRHRHAEALRRRAGTHAGGRRPARDRDDARRAAPPARAAGHRRLPAARARRRDRARGPGRRDVRRRAHRPASTPCATRSRRSTSPRWRVAAASTSTRSRRRRAASRAPSRPRSSSISASSRRRSPP